MSVSGKYLRVTLGGTTLVFGQTEWSDEDTGEPELDATDAESAGFTDTDVGPVGKRVRVRGLWSTADGPFPDIRKGIQLADVRCYANVLQTTPDLQFPLALVVGKTKQVAVRDRVQYEFAFVNKGPYNENGVLANLNI